MFGGAFIPDRVAGVAHLPRDHRQINGNRPRVATRPATNRNARPDRSPDGRFDNKAGDDVLSHRVAPAVPSALRGLTAVFGMGTGVALALWSPANLNRVER